jgi:DNA-binding response OmpR family regulator
LLKKDKFDLIFLDIKMPGVNGIEVIREKKKLGYKPRIWVITRFDSEEVARKVIAEGADDYIPKPFSLKVLDRKIRDFLAEIGKYKPR